jgi:hypothetical protein
MSRDEHDDREEDPDRTRVRGKQVPPRRCAPSASNAPHARVRYALLRWGIPMIRVEEETATARHRPTDRSGAKHHVSASPAAQHYARTHQGRDRSRPS